MSSGRKLVSLMSMATGEVEVMLLEAEGAAEAIAVPTEDDMVGSVPGMRS